MNQNVKSQFQIYFIGENSLWNQQLAKEIESAGLKISRFKQADQVFKVLAQNPPHIVIVDFDSLDLTAHEYLARFSELSPETLHVALLSDAWASRSTAILGAGFYQVLFRSIQDPTCAFYSIDRALERIYLQYHIEQIGEENEAKLSELDAVIFEKDKKLEDSLKIGMKAQRQEEEYFQKLRTLQTRINQLELENEESEVKTQRYIGDYLKMKTEKDSLSEQLKVEQAKSGVGRISYSGLVSSLIKTHTVEEATQDWLNKASLLFSGVATAFFKYVPGHPYLMLTQCAGLKLESVRGVGVNLTGLSPLEQKSFYSHTRFLIELKDLLKGAFNAHGFEYREIISDRGVLGIVVVFKTLEHEREKIFFNDSVEILNIVVHRNSLAFRVHESDFKDELTELRTQRALPAIVELEVSRARRIEKPVSLLYIHIDNFEQLIAKRGSVDIDKLVKMVALLLKKSSRMNDQLFRVDRGDFVALLPHTDREGASIKAENLRKLVEGSRQATISVGVSEYPAICRDADQLISAADEAMYDVSEEGGNQVCVATSLEEDIKSRDLSDMQELQ